jgi:hypothetical protein
MITVLILNSIADNIDASTNHIYLKHVNMVVYSSYVVYIYYHPFITLSLIVSRFKKGSSRALLL